MKVNDACHHCNTNKLLTIYLQPLQKSYNNKRNPGNHLYVVTEHSGKHCTHSSFSQSVVSETDQCDQCESVIEGKKKKSYISQLDF